MTLPLLPPPDARTLNAQCLRVLMENPLRRMTAEAVAVELSNGVNVPNLASVRSALSHSFVNFNEGWEYIHRSQGRPAVYWFDPHDKGVPEPPAGQSPVEKLRATVLPETTFTAVGMIGEAFMCRHELDGAMYVARRVTLDQIG